MPKLISYDTELMAGLGLKQNAKTLERARYAVVADWESGAQGWMGCPDDASLLKQTLALATSLKSCDTCLVLGIGGSDLGARAAYTALGHAEKGMKLVFAGNNTDPDALTAILKRLNWKKTVVNVISKSGGTLETMATFFVVWDQLQKALGARAAAHVVVTTGAGGVLHELAQRTGFHVLPVPENIGGRYSVLTPVGLFPLACAGVNARQLLAGAAVMRDSFIAESPVSHPAVQFAALHVEADQRMGRNIHVLMPYADGLSEFGRWYRQIWAESLGKSLDVGPTPVSALGATDQHSQMQLYMQGPNDKVVTFIEVDAFKHDLRVPMSARTADGLAYTAGKPFSKLIHAERRGTAEALAEAGRANGTIHLKRLDAASLGALFMLFELATATAGRLYGVNPYDQPGVEAGKLKMKAILNPRMTTKGKRAMLST